MSILDNRFLSSRHARPSLKRGLARQAFGHAATQGADLPDLFRSLVELRPNPKALEREARRLARRPGVLRVARRPSGLTVMARNLREMTNSAQSVELFSESAIVYTHILAEIRGGSLRFGIWRTSFCLHAVERLVERSAIPLDRAVLPALDTEFIAIARNASADRIIREDDERFVQGVETGLWAGGLDDSAPEPDWPFEDAKVPIFSARTFLGPNEMRPTVWLRWQDAEHLRMGD